jgi:hypothetical protein
MSKRRLIIVLTSIAVLGGATALFHFVATPRWPAPVAVPARAVPLGGFSIPPLPQHARKQLRPEIREALGFGAAAPWGRRLDLVRELPADLASSETDALLAALVAPCPPATSTAVHSTFVHEIACVLQRCREAHEPFARALAGLARDTGRDRVIRDYAVQHLRQLWDRAGYSVALRSAIVSALREFTTADPVVAAPALLSLHLLGSGGVGDEAIGATRGPGQPDAGPSGLRGVLPSFHVPDSELVPLLDAIFAAKPSADNIPARLTAARIAGERRMNGLRPVLLTTLTNPAEHTLVRMAAVVALGNIADPADLETLASLDPDDPRIAAALSHVLRSSASR